MKNIEDDQAFFAQLPSFSTAQRDNQIQGLMSYRFEFIYLLLFIYIFFKKSKIELHKSWEILMYYTICSIIRNPNYSDAFSMTQSFVDHHGRLATA